jgi:transaldolase
MKHFLDTAAIEDIRTAARWGVLDGVTTNQSLLACATSGLPSGESQ